jgi:hypothetical protein
MHACKRFWGEHSGGGIEDRYLCLCIYVYSYLDRVSSYVRIDIFILIYIDSNRIYVCVIGMSRVNVSSAVASESTVRILVKAIYALQPR